MRKRRAIAVFIIGTLTLVLLGGAAPQLVQQSLSVQPEPQNEQMFTSDRSNETKSTALENLEKLVVKGRAPKDGYSRSQFGNGWASKQGCSMRDIILNRDLTNVSFEGECVVVAGLLNDPYTGEHITFSKENSSMVQIDHVVALSDAWQKGAQQLSREHRVELANDPLNLLAVDGPANQQKGDGDAATWLPKNKAFRCQYITRQVDVKLKYSLWVTGAEKDVMKKVLQSCV